MNYGSIRSAALEQANRLICRRAFEAIEPGSLRTFIVVTPHLIHMAPLAALNHGPKVIPVFVANGLSQDDLGWLRRMSPGVPIIELQTSFSGNPDSLLTHGVVIDHLAGASEAPFCIQDADCFVLDASFWNDVTIDVREEYATCVFVREGEGDRPAFPETFLTVLNSSLMLEYRRKFSIRSESTARPSRRARTALAGAGYGEGRVLETLKNYYDTLQQFWVIASSKGFHYRKLAGEGA
ncbi:MAG: hypothetical protein ABI556_12555, partial [Gemmatimonadales bacterium]